MEGLMLLTLYIVIALACTYFPVIPIHQVSNKHTSSLGVIKTPHPHIIRKAEGSKRRGAKIRSKSSRLLFPFGLRTPPTFSDFFLSACPVLRLVLVDKPDPAGGKEGQAAGALRRAGLGLELGGCQVLGK